MDWITPENLKLEFKYFDRATVPQVQNALDAATYKLTRLVGQDAIDDTLLDSPTDTARATALVFGQKYLAASIGIFNVGQIKRQQDVGSPATQQMVTNEFYSVTELQKLSGEWREIAFDAFNTYLEDESETGASEARRTTTKAIDFVY